jgi:transposase, IS5 family
MPHQRILRVTRNQGDPVLPRKLLGDLTRRTRKRQFPDAMERALPWAALVALIAPHMPAGQRGGPPFPVEAMRRIHFMQQWFTLSESAMVKTLHGVPLFRDFAGPGAWDDRLPDETTILRFRHQLEKNDPAPRILQTVNDVLRTKGLMLRVGTVVHVTLIAMPSSTKNSSGERTRR